MRLLKIAIVALLVLSAASLFGTLFLYRTAKTELTAEKQVRAQLEQEKADTEKEMEKVKLELSQVRDARDQMARQLEEEVKLAREFSQKYEQEKTRSGGMETQFSQLQKEKEALQRQFDSLRQELQAKIDALMKENESLKSGGATIVDMATGTTAAATTTAAPTQAGSSVSLPTVKVTPERVPRVVLVNTQYKFVVVNLGQPDGLKIGDMLTIKRDGQDIARVRVSKFYDSMAACDIDSSKGPIQQGDSVSKA